MAEQEGDEYTYPPADSESTADQTRVFDYLNHALKIWSLKTYIFRLQKVVYSLFMIDHLMISLSN